MMDHNNKCIATNQSINSMKDAASMLSKKLYDVISIALLYVIAVLLKNLQLFKITKTLLANPNIILVSICVCLWEHICIGCPFV